MAIRWTGRGTAKNGKSVRFVGIDVIDLDEAGRRRHLRSCWDVGAMMASVR